MNVFYQYPLGWLTLTLRCFEYLPYLTHLISENILYKFIPIVWIKEYVSLSPLFLRLCNWTEEG